MTRLHITHETRYAYDRPVGFLPHRLLLRPRDSHAVRLVDASLALSPPGDTHWVYDAMGNCVCWFSPQGEADELRIVSRLLIERFPAPLGTPFADDPNTASPIVYDHADRLLLAPFIEPACEDESGALLRWLRGHIGRPDEPALDFLLRMNSAIGAEFAYNARQAEGVQSPAQTVSLGSGTCRDFAWLMIEALRRLGYAARFITGYLYCPQGAGVRGADSTHAWCEVFLPGLGWLEFDPTNGLTESPDLIPVATTRTPQDASPVSGAILGASATSNLFVSVRVEQAASPSQFAA